MSSPEDLIVLILNMENRQHIEVRFKELLGRFYAGKCTLSELYELQTFFERKELKAVVEHLMAGDLANQAFSPEVSFDRDRVFTELKQKIARNRQHPEVKKVSVFIRMMQVAAIIVVSFVLGGLSVYFLNRQPVVEEAPARFAYTEVVAPLGARSKVILPDSSEVWLNAGSTLKYSTNFNKSDRDLTLVGEGYFKVAKNKQLPFVVDAFGFLVKAVGTEFNVKAYEEDKTIETVLVEGKVKLENQSKTIAGDVFLDPKYKATYYKANPEDKDGRPRLVISSGVDLFPLISWKDGKLAFKGELFKDLVVELGRKYNFKFQFESDDVKDLRFTGILKDETLQQVMDMIKITSPITYRVDGKVIYIKKDNARIKNFLEK